MIVAYNENSIKDRKVGVINAFYSAYFHRIEKLSGQTLARVLQKIDEPVKRQMTDEDMFRAVQKMIGG